MNNQEPEKEEPERGVCDVLWKQLEKEEKVTQSGAVAYHEQRRYVGSESKNGNVGKINLAEVR